MAARISPSQAKNFIRRALVAIIDPPPSMKALQRIWDHLDSRCAYCDVELVPGRKAAHYDHLVSKGGNHLGNLVLSCAKCNEEEKLDLPWEDFLDGRCGGGTQSMLRRLKRVHRAAGLGIEAITWIPDTYLVANGFIDESTGGLYDPSRYGSHAAGIFFVGLEANGKVYGYALNHTDGSFKRIATIDSGNPSVVELSFDREVGYLWAVCDDTCNGRTNVLVVDTVAGSPTPGRFRAVQGFERPSTMPNYNNEGFSFAPEATCVNGFKSLFYSNDSNDGGHALRKDSIPCGPFIH